MSFKKQARARYAQLLAQLASRRSDGPFAESSEIKSLEQELKALAAALFGAKPQTMTSAGAAGATRRAA